MPRLDDIEQFKDVLDSLGSEKEILSEKGEKLEDIQPPEQGLSSDLTDLLGIQEQEGETPPSAAEPEPTPPTSEGEAFDLADLESLLKADQKEQVEEASLPVEEPAAETVPEAEGAGFEVPQEFDQDLTPPPEAEISTEQAAPSPPEEVPEAEIPSPEEEAPPTPEPSASEQAPIPPLSEGFSIDLDKEFPPSEAPPEEEAGLAEFELPDISDISEPLTEEKPSEPSQPEEDIYSGLADLETEMTPPSEAPPAETPTPEPSFEAPSMELPPVEEVSAPEPSFEVPPSEEPAIEAPTGEIPPEEAPPSEDFALDEFSLPDFGEEYGISQEAPPPVEHAVEQPVEEQEISLPVSGELPEAGEDIQLSESEFKNLQETLASLPRNLKLIIEELIGEKRLKGNNLRKLLDLLIEGHPPREIASFVSTIVGKKISLPKRFEKRTGVSFEREKESLAYIFKRKLGPAFIIAAVAIFALIALALFGYQFIYQPLAALSVYQEAYDAIGENKFDYSEQKFKEATSIWDYKDQYYRFAEAYIKKEKYGLAELKYETLLKKYPQDEKGALDYAYFLSSRGDTSKADYRRAQDIINQHILNRELFHYKGLIALGDNYLRWGDADNTRYQDALRTYQQLHERYPGEDEVMLRLLNYFVHVNNPVQVEWYKNYFRDKQYTPVDPEIYARLAGYLIDRGDMEDVKDILSKAIEADSKLPESYYELARYYSQLKQTEPAKGVLTALPGIFEKYFEDNPQKRTAAERVKKYILTYNMLGEYYYNKQEFPDPTEAEKYFTRAITLFEAASRNKDVGVDKEFGKIYANLGDIYYYVDEHDTLALEMYIQAENNLYDSPEMKYKKGYIYYKRRDYENALLAFYRASADLRNNHAILFALANTLYKRKAYSSALGNYIYLLGLLEDEKKAIAILRPEDNPLHNALMEKHYITHNNLGVTYFQLSLTLSDPEKLTQALVELENSAEIFDVLARNPDSMARLESTKEATKSTRVKKPAPEPYANMDIIMHSKNIELIIYDDLPMDIEQKRFRKKDQL
jgi:tetratricopeptide (TPR) repeat protein